MDKYFSCAQLENTVVLLPDEFTFCCLPTNGIQRPRIVNNFSDFNYENYIIQKKNLIHLNQTNEAPCRGCPQLKTKKWGESFALQQIFFATSYKCNANCTYCPQRGWKGENLPYPVNFLKEFLQNAQIDHNTLIHISGGEPTVNENFQILIDLCISNRLKMNIPTNGIITSQEICFALREGIANVVISIDASNKNIFKLVHNVDKFESVYSTILQYGSAAIEGGLCLKYIFTADNSCKEYVDEFIDIFSDVGVSKFIISLDNFNAESLNHRKDSIIKSANYMFYKCIENNIPVMFCPTVFDEDKVRIVNYL